MWTIVTIYIAQAVVCGAIHIAKNNRSPKGFKDFMQMTFLPLVIINWNNYGK